MINNNLKWCREELEMTQEELGFIFGVSKKTVSGWETANDPIPLNKIIKFCNLYHYSLDFVSGLTRRNTKCNNLIQIDKKIIGKNLKEFRTSLKLSQDKFVNKCGISQTTYSHYETGLNLITTSTLFAICKTYQVSMDYLLGRTKNKFLKK